MSKQLYEIGAVIQAGANALEVTSVTYQEDENGQKIRYAYTVRVKSELDAERAEEAQRAKAAEVAAAEHEKLAPTEGADNDTAGESEEV